MRRWTEEAAWDETLALTSDAPVALQNTEDDLERELAFYNQVRCAALCCSSVLCCAVLPFFVLVPAYCSRYKWVFGTLSGRLGGRLGVGAGHLQQTRQGPGEACKLLNSSTAPAVSLRR